MQRTSCQSCLAYLQIHNNTGADRAVMSNTDMPPFHRRRHRRVCPGIPSSFPALGNLAKITIRICCPMSKTRTVATLALAMRQHSPPPHCRFMVLN